MKLGWVPLLKRKATSNKSQISSARVEKKKFESPSKNMSFTNLQRKVSNNSLFEMISPPKQDPFMQEISNYDENMYSDFLSFKKKDSFLGEEIPFGLFRNFSLRES